MYKNMTWYVHWYNVFCMCIGSASGTTTTIHKMAVSTILKTFGSVTTKCFSQLCINEMKEKSVRFGFFFFFFRVSFLCRFYLCKLNIIRTHHRYILYIHDILYFIIVLFFLLRFFFSTSSSCTYLFSSVLLLLFS